MWRHPNSLGDGLVAIADEDAAVTSYLKSYELDRRSERALRAVRFLNTTGVRARDVQCPNTCITVLCLFVCYRSKNMREDICARGSFGFPTAK